MVGGVVDRLDDGGHVAGAVGLKGPEGHDLGSWRDKVY